MKRPISLVLKASLSLLFLGFLGAGCQPDADGPRPNLSPPRTGGLRLPTRFTIDESTMTSWLRKPSGHRFFAFGVSGVDLGVSLQAFDANNPAYSAARLFDNERFWATTVLGQLKRWNLNTIGAWSSWPLLREAGSDSFITIPVLHLGAAMGFPWEDMWDPGRVAKLKLLANRSISPWLDDVRVVGYYSDSELDWRNAALFNHTLTHPPMSGQRKILIDLLEQRYGREWTRLLTDFIPEEADGFTTLRQGGGLHLRAGGKGIEVYRMFLRTLANRYYSLMRSSIRNVDPHALFLGDRYADVYYPEVAEAAGDWVDIISSNLKVAWNNGDPPRFFLDTLHQLSGRPVYVSEVYFAAMENQSGNRNTHGGFPTAKTQAERSRAAARMLTQMAVVPSVVGIDWFQYYDEPPEGRADGEDYNMGLVDIQGQPYAELTRALSRLDFNQLHGEGEVRRIATAIPVAPFQPLADFEPGLALNHWNRSQGFIPPSQPKALADLYACWASDVLYFGVYTMNLDEVDYYHDRIIPPEDRMSLLIHLPISGVTIAKTLGLPPQVRKENQELALPFPHFELNYANRSVLVIGVPQKLFQATPLGPGQPVSFQVELRGHARQLFGRWTKRLTLAPE